MKLYATTTSERASKGQGGNEFIYIAIMNEKRENIALINFKILKNNIIFNFETMKNWGISSTKNENGGIIYNGILGLESAGITKGEKQKSEKIVHKCYIDHTSGQYKGLSIPHYHE